MTDFPTSKDDRVDNVDDVMADDINSLQDKVGIDSDTAIDSLDYKIRNNLHQNLLKNGNFINNSANGYGTTPDDWTSSSANPVQGGMPTLTKAELISILGISDGDIEGLWPLNEASGNAIDLSSNSYDLTETGGTIAANKDGLMATARDFDVADTEHFVIAHADCANLEFTTSQTWFCFYKPTTLASSRLMDKKTNARSFASQTTGRIDWSTGGLTPSVINSNTRVEAGKWYMIVGIYDSVGDKIKLWINGVKQEKDVIDSLAASTSDFVIGALNTGASNYVDGLLQNAGILSVALTNDQVKRFWAYTSYKGAKIRRDGTDALLYQDLSQDLVARLRGKTVTLRARVRATSTNHRIYIYDSTTTSPVSPASADTYEDVSVTATIAADATQIRIGLEADTTDGNMWIEQVALYEGSSKLPYDHSKEDWSEFSELLKMSGFGAVNGYTFKSGQVKSRIYLGTDQENLVSSDWTKVLLDTESYDVGSNFASNKFTVPVNGYYLVTGNVYYKNIVLDKRYQAAIYVNGAVVTSCALHASLAASISVPIYDIIYLNSGDYVELYAVQVSGADTVDISSGSSITFMSTHLLST